MEEVIHEKDEQNTEQLLEGSQLVFDQTPEVGIYPPSYSTYT